MINCFILFLCPSATFSPVHPFHLKGFANRANASQRDLEIPRRLRLRICKNFHASNFLWIQGEQVSRDNWVCQYEKSIPSFGCKNDSAKFPNMATLFLWPLTHPHFEEAAGRPPSYEATFNRSLGMWKLHFSVTTSGTSLWKSTAMAAPACAPPYELSSTSPKR